MRKIIHCDADCFFAAVEMRDNPALKNVPMAIAGSLSRRGVISTCNYEARRFGIRSAMPTWQARSLCPDLTLIPHNMDKYREASQSINRIFATYSSQVETVSIDEAYLDVSDNALFSGSATLLASDIRESVRREVGITVSAGVAPNKFLAKVASEWKKPDGLFVIPPEKVGTFLEDLPVEYIQGVGKKTAQRLHNLGYYTCGDLQKQPLSGLIRQFGRFGSHLFEMAQGIDKRQVVTSRLRKSLSVEHTFQDDLNHPGEYRLALRQLFDRLTGRLEKLRGDNPINKLQVKIKFNNFHQTTVETPSCRTHFESYLNLVHEGLEREGLPVRLLGIGVQFMNPIEQQTLNRQLTLFDG